VARRHRLTIEPNQLTQPPRDPGFRISKPDPLGADAACLTAYTPLPIHQRHPVGPPRQVVPYPVLGIAHPPGSASASAAGMPSNPSSLGPNPKLRVVFRSLKHDLLHSVSLQPKNPGKLGMRSHGVLPLCLSHQEKTASDGPMTSGIAPFTPISTTRRAAVTLPSTWVEDTAMPGSNPSADPRPKTEPRCACRHPVSRSAVSTPPFWEQRVKSRGLGAEPPDQLRSRPAGAAETPRLADRAVAPKPCWIAAFKSTKSHFFRGRVWGSYLQNSKFGAKF
jgi:hypothetical protein